MVDIAKFKPKTVYVSYIASRPETVWEALTSAEFTTQYFVGFAAEVEPRVGGTFRLLTPDDRVQVRGEIVDWSPPRRFASTWIVEGMKDFGELPAGIVGYDIEPSGEAVKLTMMESYDWDVPEDMLSGGCSGWPNILSSLKSLLETGSPVRMKIEGPPLEFMAAVKPWLN
jgi:uncharacterized protein YndB with AHSA1/START domain